MRSHSSFRRSSSTAFATAAFILITAVIGFSQAQYDTSPQAQTGNQPYGSYFASDIDNINAFNGNLNINISLFTLPGRQLSTGVGFAYNSQKWEQQICNDGGNQIYCGYYTGGWRLNSGPWGQTPTTFNPMDGTGFHIYWIDGNGTKKHYCCVPVGGATNASIPSADSDGSVFFTGNFFTTQQDPSNAFIAFKDGSRRYYTDSPSFMTATGNYITVTSTACSLFACVVPNQDTLGRTIQVQPYGSSILYKITDANGVLQTYTLQYESNSVCDPWYGWPWNGTYPGCTYYTYQTQIASLTLPNGKSYQFQYSHPQGYLTKVTLPSGAYIRYVYATPSSSGPGPYDQVVQRIVSADGTQGSEKTWTYTGYEGLGTVSFARTVTITSPEGDKVVHQFNAQGEEVQTQWETSTNTVLKTVVNSWSQQSIFSNNQPQNAKVNTIATLSESGQPSARQLTYDTNMNLTQEMVTDWQWGVTGARVIYERDLTYASMTNCNINAPGPGNFIKPSMETITAIDPTTGNFVQQGSTQYFYDEFVLAANHYGAPNHNDSFPYNYYCQGNLTTVRHYKDANNYVDEHMHYDNLGNMVQKVDPLSHTTNIDFTDNFADGINRNTFAYPKTVTNALSQSSATKYDFKTGLPTQVTNLRGYNTITTYDLLNRVKSLTEANGKVTTYAYDDTNLVTTKEVLVDSSGNKGHVETSFDGLYRVKEVRTNDPDPQGVYAVDTTYDGKGRKKQVSNPYRLSTETPVWTTVTYDALDRPTQVQAPDMSTVQNTYSNNQTTVIDEGGNQRRYTYNVRGQMTMVEEPNPTLATPLVTNYAYYGFGPLYQSNQSGQLRTYVYNWLGQKTSQTLPESGTTTFAYDNAGRLTSQQDARGITSTIAFAYDNINRVTSTTYSDGTPTVTTGYDANGFTGLKTSMTDAVGSVTYTYDNMNQPTLESRTLTGISGTFTTSYGHNIKGDLTSMTYPSGRVVNFNYATGGGCCNSRLASVADQTTGTILNGSMNYNAGGGLLNSMLGNGIVQTVGYNARLQATSINATLSGMSLMNFSYNYGTSSTNTGRLLSRTDAIQPEHSATYSYDSIYRLGAVASGDPSASWGIAWTFDVWGNRVSQTPVGVATSTIGTQTSGYTNNRNNANTYDVAGNQTADSLHTYTFNALNQITSIDGGTAAYVYDGNGNRMKKVTSSETTYTFYGPGGIISEFTTSNTIATKTAAANDDRCFYHTSDKLGSAVLVMTANGTVIENNRTLPYGEAWLPSDNGQPTTNDKKFTTFQRDSESGFDYAGARYLSNSGGRFASVDPGSIGITTPQSLNRYAYVMNDPINHKDSGGKECYSVMSSGVLTVQCYYDDPFADIPIGGDIWQSLDPSALGSVQLYLAALYAYQVGQPVAQPAVTDAAQSVAQRNMADGGQIAKMQNDARQAYAQALSHPDCATLFGGLGNMLNTLGTTYIDIASNTDSLLASSGPASGAYSVGMQQPKTIAFSIVGQNNGLESNYILLKNSVFDLTPSQQIFVMLHELYHIVHPLQQDTDPGFGQIASACDVPAVDPATLN
jgi:RHS repeat-associated protein